MGFEYQVGTGYQWWYIPGSLTATTIKTHIGRFLGLLETLGGDSMDMTNHLNEANPQARSMLLWIYDHHRDLSK